jgi:hypothetical protein
MGSPYNLFIEYETEEEQTFPVNYPADFAGSTLDQDHDAFSHRHLRIG